MSTAPYMFPTMSPWFDIPAFQTVKEVGDIKKALPQASQFSTVMLTGFPQSIRSQSFVAQLFSGYFTKGHSWSVNVLSLQRRAFVFFPCWDSCHSFLEGYLTRKPSPGKDFVLKVHLVLEDMHPGDNEETMYKNLMRWSNAHVSEPESLSQRLICVTFSDVTLSVIQSVLMAVASLAPFVNYLVLAERVYIEMCDSSSVALVLDLLLFNRLSEEEKKMINDSDQKKKKDVWRKLENVHLFKVKNVRLVQRQPPAGGAVPGLAEGAPDKTRPAGVEAAACEQQQTEAAEEEDVGTDSAEDRTENKSCTQEPQTPADKLSKEEEELIDCVTDQKDELNEEEEKPAEKQKTAGKESEMRGGSAAKDETSSSEDVLATRVSENAAAGNSGGDDKPGEEPTARRDNVLTSESRAKITESKTNEEETPAEKQETAGKESEMRGGSAAKDETSSSEDVTAGGQNEEEEKEASTKPEEVGAETLRSADGSGRSSPVLDQSVNAAASCELEETKQEVTSARKRGRPRKKPRKTPVRKSAGGKPESPEENREEEETKSLPGASLDSSSAVLGHVKMESEAAEVLDQSVNAAAAAELEETEETEQEVTSIRKGGRSRKKPRKTPVRKSAGGKPENLEENREEEKTKSLPETDAEGPDRQNLDRCLEEEEEDEGRSRADGEALEEETVPSVLDQSVNAAASCELEETKQEVTSTRKRGRPRKKPRKTPVRKSAGGKPEENREEEETKSLPGVSLDSSSAVLGHVKTETDTEAAEGPDKQNLDGRLEEEEEEDEEVTCKKQRQSPCTVGDFILPPFNPDISFGEEFTARKLGYFCSLCSVFYVLKSNEEDTHCCSRNHYDNLLKHSQMKEEQPSPPPKRKTRNSR